MRTALLQTCASDDPEENCAELGRLVDEAAALGAQFILTPEVSNCVSTSREHQCKVLRHSDQDHTLITMRKLVQEHGVHLLIGSLALKSDDPNERFVNRSLLIDPSGNVQAWYDKIHMFDVEIGDGESYRESAGYRPGMRAVVAHTDLCTLGMCICYDVRFPALAHRLADAGAQVLTYPSAFSPVTGAAHWETLLRARAIETGCWVLAPAQTGTHPTTAGRARSTFGHSMVIDPWGEVILDAGTSTGVYTVDLNLDKVADARARIPALTHARTFDGPT